MKNNLLLLLGLIFVIFAFGIQTSLPSSQLITQSKKFEDNIRTQHSKLGLITLNPNKVLAKSITKSKSEPNCKDIKPAKGKPALKLQLITKGLGSLTDIVFAPGENQRIYVLEQNKGAVRVIFNNRIIDKPFLDIRNSLSTGGERGLLGMVFHPNFQKNRKFYLYYTNKNGDVEISEFLSSLDLNLADSRSKKVLLTIRKPASNHNGGAIRFGHDGFLYLGVGDGGLGGDPFGKTGNGQDLNSKLGKILRIDVDNLSNNNLYTIPSDNPYATHKQHAPEILHWGLRNPWRISFDRLTGDLWIGDVGQNLAEEINFAPSGSKNLNFGWRCKEGILDFKNDPNCTGANLIDPVVHLKQDHQNSPYFCSIMSGYIYRGCNMPDYHGTFFFGDYCKKEIYSFDWDGKTPSNSNKIENISINNLTSWGEDNFGELYLVTGLGEVFKLVAK